MADRRLEQLQVELQRIPGVRSARVVGDELPTEIHIIASPDRTAKQLVRDVQSLAAAGFELPIDHRIVSVVQLREVTSEAPAEPRPRSLSAGERSPEGRPVLERVVQADKGDQGWVKVALRWPDGTVTEGVGESGMSRTARARGGTAALLHALRPVLDARKARLDVDHVACQRVGSVDTVLVRATYYRSGATSPLVGIALVHDDAAGAAVRALLHALNRRLHGS
ncbi:MAG: hypothetical protein M3454_02825 [Actinomycetota bacterium]|nr:hypothetical protein [Actinomycetota bacterium]